MSLDMSQYPSVSRAEQTTSYTGGFDFKLYIKIAEWQIWLFKVMLKFFNTSADIF